MATPQISRRALLAVGAGAAATGIAGCSNSSSSSGSAKAAVPPPTYVAFDAGGAKPDLPGNTSGLPPAYFSYPSSPVKRDGIPLPAGDPVKGLLQGIPPANPPEKNPWLQAIFKDAGATLDVTTIQSTDFLAKLQVVISGGDVPDLVQMQTVPQLPKVLDKLFVDLSDHLSGDGVKKYPGLAAIPTGTWKTAMLNGRIWGIPQPRSPLGSVNSTRGDLLEKRGIDANPKLTSGQDFLDLCKEVTDTKRGVYAMGALYTFPIQFFAEMMGAPAGWRIESDGSWTQVYQTDEYTAAVEQMTKFWKSGMMHPDSFNSPGSNYSWWSSGTTYFYVQSIAGWSGYAQPNPSWNIGVIRPPKWDGGGWATKVLAAPSYGTNYISFKKADDKRIEQLLSIADYFSSPFGTQEYLTFNYGVEGTDYKLQDSDPVALPAAKGDSASAGGLPYMGSQLYNQIYVPGQRELVKSQYEFDKAGLADGVTDPSIGLYSETAVTKGGAWGQKFVDALGETIQGRAPISAWTDTVKQWRSEVGDAIARELAEAKSKQ